MEAHTHTWPTTSGRWRRKCSQSCKHFDRCHRLWIPNNNRPNLVCIGLQINKCGNHFTRLRVLRLLRNFSIFCCPDHYRKCVVAGDKKLHVIHIRYKGKEFASLRSLIAIVKRKIFHKSEANNSLPLKCITAIRAYSFCLAIHLTLAWRLFV